MSNSREAYLAERDKLIDDIALQHGNRIMEATGCTLNRKFSVEDYVRIRACCQIIISDAIKEYLLLRGDPRSPSKPVGSINA